MRDQLNHPLQGRIVPNRDSLSPLWIHGVLLRRQLLRRDGIVFTSRIVEAHAMRLGLRGVMTFRPEQLTTDAYLSLYVHLHINIVMRIQPVSRPIDATCRYLQKYRARFRF